MPSITLQNVEFTLDPEQFIESLDSFAALDLSDMLDEIVSRHPMGLIVRLAKDTYNRSAMAAELAGFGDNPETTEVDEEDDEQAFLDKANQFVQDNGMYRLIEEAELRDEVVEYATEYQLDAVIEALQADGSIPAFDLDDVKYNVRELIRLAESIANDIDA